MSHAGKLTRGKKWYDKRGQDSELPSGVANDPNKMNDVNYYLKFLEGKVKEDVDKAIDKLFFLSKQPMILVGTEYKAIKDSLKNWVAKVEVKVKEKK